MKNLKFKNIVFSLMAIAVIAVLATSCNQTDLLTNEFQEVNPTVLAEKLANNPNFQASIKIHEQIENDLMKLMEDNPSNIAEGDMDIVLNTVSEEEFALYKTNLFNDMPELHSITEQVFEEAVMLSSNLLGKQDLNARNCSYTYSICAYNAYYRYFYSFISYNSYITELNTCIQQYYNCI